MAYSPIGDTIALTKLAYTLYSRVIIVARHAPDQFDDLIRDLDVYKRVLYRIQSRVEDASDKSYGVAVHNVLAECFRALHRLGALTTKYENLAWSNRGDFFKRIAWAKDQETIKSFRETFREQQQLLQLALSTEGRNNLSGKQEYSVLDDDKTTLVARQDSLTDESLIDARCNCGFLPVHKSVTTSTTDSVKTSCSPRGSLSRSSPRAGGSGCHPSHETILSRTRSTAQEDLKTEATSYPNSIGKARTGSSDCRVNGIRGSVKDECHSRLSCEGSCKEYQDLRDGEPPVADLSPLQTKTQQPLELLQERETHSLPSDVQKILWTRVESISPPISTERWLRLAIWWLVKSRIISDLLAQAEVTRRGTDASQHQNRWHSTVSMEQAYTDLLKSSWILEEVVLAGAGDEDLSYISIRKMVKDLSRSLHNDLQEIRYSIRAFRSIDKDGLLKHDLHLFESFEQTIEADESIPAAIDDPDSALRWFEIDQDNAGRKHENVIFRTFVNAQLGSRSHRSKSPSAPYMLLLWTAVGSCDIFVSLCNHRGSVNLSRKLTVEDLERYKAGDTLFSINFPTQEAEVKFLRPEDAAAFCTQPLLFFAALTDIKPRPGELAIFQASLSSYSECPPRLITGNLRARTLVSSDKSSCGLRVYECMPDKCWKVTRRLVVNTPPDITKPECISHWLPADRIQMVVEGTKVIVKWSDCGQLVKKDEGNLLYHCSYIYRADQPNRKITLEFSSNSDAQAFENCLLLITEMPPQVSTKINLPSNFQDIRICRLEDVDEPDHQYHSIVLTKKTPKGPHTTEIYYVYRDLDWIFSAKNGTLSIVDFPSLQTSDYVSTMPKFHGMPRASDPTPECSDVVEKFRAAHFDLSCDPELKEFMHSLTGWTLKIFRPLSKLLLVETGHLFKNPKEQYRQVYVQLWEKAAEQGQPRIQLAVRLGEKTATSPWITASLLEVLHRSEHSSMGYNVEFPALSLNRGVEVDTKHMTATMRGGAKEEAANQRQWKITLTFLDTIHKDEFLMASRLVKMPAQYIG